MLTVNALTAANGVIIPMHLEYFALEGVSQMMISMKQIKKIYNPGLTLTGILVTVYNGRLNLSLQVIDEIKKYYAGKLFKTTVARNVRLSEAPSYGEPIQYYDKHAKGTDAYNSIAKELLERI
jgi:chromosome partitioning protein